MYSNKISEEANSGSRIANALVPRKYFYDYTIRTLDTREPLRNARAGGALRTHSAALRARRSPRPRVQSLSY